MAKKVSTNTNCFSNAAERQKQLETILAQILPGKPFCTVWVTDNTIPARCDPRFQSKPIRCLIILEGLPVSTDSLKAWRSWASDEGVIDLKMAFVKPEVTENEILNLVRAKCSKWLTPVTALEQPEVRKGEWICLPDSPKKHDPALLTMMFGSMGDLLTRMDLIGSRFRKGCQLKEELKRKHKDSIRAMLTDGSGDPSKLSKLDVTIESLPRVLLRGETGVGKTLFARSLAGGSSDFRKVFIPEFLNKEDMLEYDLFGYASGAYTDGKKEGDIGKLLNAVGGVIFLDEIGTASPSIQAKLLGYMDDYRVEPRGWTYGSFECPTLVVAATNLSMKELESEKFRPDLLARFTDIVEVPPLSQRMEDLPFILDCLLQSPGINPIGPAGKQVEAIGCNAFNAIKEHEFKANFRELENVLRKACESALREGRDTVCRSDLDL